MSWNFRVAVLLLIASTGAATAQAMCGDPPIAPVIPSAAEMRAKAPADAAAVRHSAFAIRRWQGSLKSYRDCLNATIATDKRDMGEVARSDKPDKDKIANFGQEITASNHAFDASVDQEEKVVNEFHAAQVAYCERKDVDISTCPKT